jgi:hypothetical protein
MPEVSSERKQGHGMIHGKLEPLDLNSRKLATHLTDLLKETFRRSTLKLRLIFHSCPVETGT